MAIGPKQEEIILDVIKLRGTPILLGNGWLSKYGVKINFEKPQLKFQSDYCWQNCDIPPSFTIASKCTQRIKKPNTLAKYLEEIKEAQEYQRQ